MVKTKPVLCVSASIGWAVRNYFQTGIIDSLTDHFDVVVVAPPSIREEIQRQNLARHVTWVDLPTRPEPASWRLFRQLRKKVYAESRQSHTENIWAQYSKRPWHQRLGATAVRWLLRVVSPARLFGFIERMDYLVNRDDAAREVFARYRPSLFFATHASLSFEERLLRSAVACDVPVVFMVLSWDHLSSKFLLSTRYESILVWNDVTKDEILSTYPCYSAEQIRVVGAPQFDVHADAPDVSYADWCLRWGLDPDKRTILFTTAPHVRHEQQHIIARDLLEAIANGGLPADVQLFIKCHPFDENPGYDELRRHHAVAIYRPSAGLADAQEEWIPSAEELALTRDTLAFCAVNLNVFSTVTLEAAYRDKPIVHIAFDPEPVTHRIPTREYYAFDHFRRIVDMGPGTLVYSQAELVEAVRRYVDNPALHRTERQQVARTFLGTTVGQATALVHDALVELGTRAADRHR